MRANRAVLKPEVITSEGLADIHAGNHRTAAVAGHLEPSGKRKGLIPLTGGPGSKSNGSLAIEFQSAAVPSLGRMNLATDLTHAAADTRLDLLAAPLIKRKEMRQTGRLGQRGSRGFFRHAQPLHIFG